MSRLVVFGAAGFLGRNLLDGLRGRGHTVLAVDRARPDVSAEDADWLVADFLDPSTWQDFLAEGDIVYHLISTTLPKSSNENVLFDVQSNLGGTLTLLNACVARRVKKVVFLSSGGTIYGAPQRLPLDEAHPTNPLSSYGVTKLAIEKYLHLYRHLFNLDYQIFRLSNPYGPHQNPLSSQGAIGVFLYRALTRQRIEVWGDGSVVRDYIYISDVVEALMKAIHYTGKDRILNLGSGTGYTLREIIDRISMLLDTDIDVSYTNARSLDVKNNILDVKLINRSIGWFPKVSLDEGLVATRDYLTKMLQR